MNQIKMILTNYLGIKKVIEFDPDQVKEIGKLKDYKKRLKAMADRHSGNYWVDVIIDDKNFYSVQWAQV